MQCACIPRLLTGNLSVCRRRRKPQGMRCKPVLDLFLRIWSFTADQTKSQHGGYQHGKIPPPSAIEHAVASSLVRLSCCFSSCLSYYLFNRSKYFCPQIMNFMFPLPQVICSLMATAVLPASLASRVEPSLQLVWTCPELVRGDNVSFVGRRSGGKSRALNSQQ